MEITLNENITTEFGIIPSDWQIKEFQDVMTGFFSGATPYRGRPEYYKGHINWITSGELDYNIITDTIEKITEEAVRNTNLKILPKGTFLFAITGLEAEGTRGSCAITGIDATTNQSCMALFPLETLDINYLYHYYVWMGKPLALKYCQGTKQQSYTGKIARKLPIILPPTKSEQTAIATALSDTDALIENLEKLIAKKRNIKQGVMQELLTGRKRLRGFSNEWKLKQVGKIADVGRGRVISHREIDKALESKYPVYSSQTSNDGIMGYLDTYDFDGEYITWTTDGVNAGKVFHRLGKFNCTNVCGTIRLKNDYAPFVALILDRTTPRHVSINLANPKLMNDPMKKIEILLPAFEEQKAIAEILSELGNEIKALQHKLNKYRMIKQGMMQSLLTGKIRLV